MATNPTPPETGRDTGRGSDPESVDDFLPADPHRMTLGMRLLYVVVVLIAAGMVGYLVLIVMYPEQFASKSWIGTKAPQQTVADADARKAARGFELGGVWLGITPADARALYPDIRFEPDTDGGSTGVFPHHDGEYRVSFHRQAKGERAYRISSRHAYEKVSYLELLAELAGKYGRPGASACGAEEGTVAIRCTLQWDKRDTALDAQIRTVAPAGGGESRTTLTVTATDLRPDDAFAAPAPGR
jgi:hypothetical protein